MEQEKLNIIIKKHKMPIYSEKSICLVCKKEHYEEYDRYFCSKVCEKRWDAIIFEKVMSSIDETSEKEIENE